MSIFAKDLKLINENLSNFDDTCKKISKIISFIIIDKNKCFNNKNFESDKSEDLLLLKFSD
jgi:hypothetical protein